MVLRFLALALALLTANGCARLTLAWADEDAKGPPARPPAFDGAAPTIEQWEARKPALRRAFEENIYGYLPEESSTEILSRRVIDETAYGGAAIMEEYALKATARFGETARDTTPFYLDVVLPRGEAPHPVILMETFCPRADTIVHQGVTRAAEGFSCGGEGPMHKVMLYLFGRYIVTPPVEMILAHGYGLAVLYPSEAVPDDKEAGSAALAALAEGHADTATRWGAIAAWGWLYSRAADALLADERIDPKGLIAWGHSRYAKAALLAAAFDDRFDAVIAHQSGAGGASLNRKKAGESIKAITKTYPHWFSARYARYADKAETLPVDQHQLLALVAPRPILLGNARRDVWSDPAGALRAARGADPVYELYGETGLDQARMTPFSPQAELSFWIRPGTHGVVEEDWPAFLAFLDAHIGARRIAAPRTSSR